MEKELIEKYKWLYTNRHLTRENALPDYSPLIKLGMFKLEIERITPRAGLKTKPYWEYTFSLRGRETPLVVYRSSRKPTFERIDSFIRDFFNSKDLDDYIRKPTDMPFGTICRIYSSLVKRG